MSSLEECFKGLIALVSTEQGGEQAEAAPTTAPVVPGEGTTPVDEVNQHADTSLLKGKEEDRVAAEQSEKPQAAAAEGGADDDEKEKPEQDLEMKPSDVLADAITAQPPVVNLTSPAIMIGMKQPLVVDVNTIAEADLVLLKGEVKEPTSTKSSTTAASASASEAESGKVKGAKKTRSPKKANKVKSPKKEESPKKSRGGKSERQLLQAEFDAAMRAAKMASPAKTPGKKKTDTNSRMKNNYKIERAQKYCSSP
ncbi:unnamed protein product [Amoebophrya sp. A120]|nr:unnamed protein product [Amoebophrya sp. A120]|eukprot:GSA120T00004300001.1